MNLNPSRLRLARQRRGMTMTALAQASGYTTRSIGGFERGEREAPAEATQRLAEVLGFPVAFLCGDDLDELQPEGASFRSLSTMSSAQRDSVIAAGTLATTLETFLTQRFNLPASDLPDLDGDDPEIAASALRAHWQLANRPIPNVVHLLEAKGVRVFSLAEDCVTVDAFSIWHRNIPFVFLNVLKSGERGRFDAAHELGHLVLHRHGSPEGRVAEEQANRFASAFLMPRPSVIAEAPLVPNLPSLLRLKAKWKVSIAAMVRRLFDVGVIRQWHYDRLNIEIAKRGWRKTEPQAIERETSRLLDQTFKELRQDGIDHSVLARSLKLSPDDLSALIFGLTLASVPGGVRKGVSPRSRAKLQLV